MSLQTVKETHGRRIIIEGPDGVGKDTFIAGLQDFIDGVDRFNKTNLIASSKTFLQVNHTGEKIYGEEATAYAESVNLSGRDPEEVYTWGSEADYQPRYANMVSYRSIHSKDGSPESAEFIRKLDAGEITDQRAIAEEYLQVHFDLENLADRLSEVLDLVIMNRSLISYHAMQIHTLGFTDLEEKWTKLWNYADQENALYVRLTAPEEVVRERLAKRQNVDFRGEVENYYMDRWRSIEQGFVNFQKSGRCPLSMTVDTTQEATQYYQAILQWVILGQLHDSIERQ